MLENYGCGSLSLHHETQKHKSPQGIQSSKPLGQQHLVTRRSVTVVSRPISMPFLAGLPIDSLGRLDIVLLKRLVEPTYRILQLFALMRLVQVP